MNTSTCCYITKVAVNQESIQQIEQKKKKKIVTLELCLAEDITILNIYFKYMIHFHRVMLDQYIRVNWSLEV